MTSRRVYLGAPEGFTALAEVIAGRAELEHVEAERTAVAEALFDASALLDASMKVYIDLVLWARSHDCDLDVWR